MEIERRIWFLLHLFFLSSGGFAFRHLTGSLRKGIRSICGFPTVLCVVISSSLFYEYMNIFNGHLSLGRFPVDKFLRKGMILLHPPTLFSLHFIPEKIRTTASVFDYGYFKIKFIFYPLRPKGYVYAVAMQVRVMFTEIIFTIIIERPFIFIFVV
jgi:hypothetical protein